jgi:NitT/TauT family transport system substrate-binding protein
LVDEKVTRRGWLKTAVGTVVGFAVGMVGGYLAGTARAPPPTPAPEIAIVTFQTGWAFVGRDAPFFLAMEKGYYEEEGLSLRIFRGYGTSDVLKNMEAKKFDFGMPGTSGTIKAIAEGAQLKIVAMLHLRSVNGVIVRKDSGIKGPQDMVGKIYGQTFASETSLLLPYFLEINGVDPATVEMRNLDPGVAVSALLAGETDICGFYSESPSAALWEKVNHINFADWGLDVYNNAIVAHLDLMAENPELIRRFLKATFMGIRDAMANPEEAVDAMHKYRPELKREDIRIQLAFGLQGYLGNPEETAKLGLGWVTEEKMAFTQKIASEAFGFEEVPLERIYTNEYLTKILPPENAEENINAIIAEVM